MYLLDSCICGLLENHSTMNQLPIHQEHIACPVNNKLIMVSTPIIVDIPHTIKSFRPCLCNTTMSIDCSMMIR